MLVVKGARVFAPADRGVCDVAIQQGRIVAVDRAVVEPSDAAVVDASGAWVLPGLIDNHLHTIGGGGERGPGSRPGRIHAGTLIGCGVTTVAGCLGFDATSRSLADPYLHTLPCGTRACRRSCSPAPLTCHPHADRQRTARRLPGRAGHRDRRDRHRRWAVVGPNGAGDRAARREVWYINLRLGEVPGGLTMVGSLIQTSGLPVERFLPTHVNRASSVLAEAAECGRLGGFLDLTASITPADGYDNALSVLAAVDRLTTSGIDAGRITVSSDSGGTAAARPDDPLGMVGQTTPFHLLRELRGLVSSGYGIDTAASFFTANVARALGMPMRGEIAVGRIANLTTISRRRMYEDAG